MSTSFSQQLAQHIEVMQTLAAMESQIQSVADAWIAALRKGGKVLLMGNGGSAADAQHIAAELVGRYLTERRGLPGIALTTDTSILTAVGNDYGYNSVFSRQVEALAQPDDVIVGYSTSGNSANVIAAFEVAKSIGCYCVALTGASGGKMKDVVDNCLRVPSDFTPRIQEAHAFIGHMLCDYVDQALTPAP